LYVGDEEGVCHGLAQRRVAAAVSGEDVRERDLAASGRCHFDLGGH
jgi:hypothetical protein